MRRGKTKTTPTTEIMRRDEVASLLGVSRRTLEDWARRGVGPAFRRVGREALYLRSDVDAWFVAQPVFGSSDGGPQHEC